jgi:signal transduction histidine kinase
LRGLAQRRQAPPITLALPEILQVVVDAGRIEQAVDNLLENACAVAGRVLLAAEQNPGSVAVHVCDDGPGIPPELRARIFQPFVSRSPGGTGLGLSIVARIAAAHGGSIALGERAGWATCLTLHLPVAA